MTRKKLHFTKLLWQIEALIFYNLQPLSVLRAYAAIFRRAVWNQPITTDAVEKRKLAVFFYLSGKQDVGVLSLPER